MNYNYEGPGRYRHYKGGEYEVLGLGREEATHRTVVIYIAHAFQIEDPNILFWTRPLDDFNETVHKSLKSPILVPRFTRLY